MSAAQRIEASAAMLGEGMPIRRALPTKQRRLVGAWCFLDHFGPHDVSHGRGMRVGPHPHIGLQTVTWLLNGEILHRDSLGNEKLIRPGQLNLMTSGRGISHSEESPQPRAPEIHGLQFWIALPESARHMPPGFDHYPELPQSQSDGLHITVFAGEMLGLKSPARVHTRLVGADLALTRGADVALPLAADFEHALLVTQGSIEADGETLTPGTLLYLPCGRDSLRLRSDNAARLALVGGVPFSESALMWWNFVGRSQQELTQACRDWNAGADYFGKVRGYDGAALVAPLPPWAA